MNVNMRNYLHHLNGLRDILVRFPNKSNGGYYVDDDGFIHVGSKNVNLISDNDQIITAINFLREGVGDVVCMPNDNPDFGGYDNFVYCKGCWTKWKTSYFYGESILECLEKAVFAKRKEENK